MRCSVSHTCKAEISSTCYKQTSITTNVVNDTTYFFASASSWMRNTAADEHKFLAVKRLSRRLLERSKNAIFTYPTCIWSPRCGDFIGVSSRFSLHRKTRVPWLTENHLRPRRMLPPGESCWVCADGTDRQTNGRTYTRPLLYAFR